MNDFWMESNMEDMLSCSFQQEKEEKCDAEPAAPANAEQRNLLKLLQDAKTAKCSCFGGVLLSRYDANNKPILSFVVEGMTDREAEKMEAEYDDLFRSGLNGMIHGASHFVEKFENYTVFNFLHNPNRMSLRSYWSQGKKLAAPFMMRKLLDMLVERYDSSEEGYKSLNCFSPDTIFVDGRGSMWLLPLRAFHNCFPCQIAPEAHDPGYICDERSDLYAAAYVSLEAENGGKLCDMELLENGMFKDCLVGIPQCRPSLRRMAQTYCGIPAGQIKDRPKPNMQNEKPAIKEQFGSKMRELVDRIVQFVKKLTRTEPQDQVRGTQNEYNKSIFRPIAPIRDFDQEGV